VTFVFIVLHNMLLLTYLQTQTQTQTHTHTHTSASEMTYIVSGGALNSTHSLTHTHTHTDTLKTADRPHQQWRN